MTGKRSLTEENSTALDEAALESEFRRWREEKLDPSGDDVRAFIHAHWGDTFNQIETVIRMCGAAADVMADAIRAYPLLSSGDSTDEFLYLLTITRLVQRARLTAGEVVWSLRSGHVWSGLGSARTLYETFVVLEFIVQAREDGFKDIAARFLVNGKVEALRYDRQRAQVTKGESTDIKEKTEHVFSELQGVGEPQKMPKGSYWWTTPVLSGDPGFNNIEEYVGRTVDLDEFIGWYRASSWAVHPNALNTDGSLFPDDENEPVQLMAYHATRRLSHPAQVVCRLLPYIARRGIAAVAPSHDVAFLDVAAHHAIRLEDELVDIESHGFDYLDGLHAATGRRTATNEKKKQNRAKNKVARASRKRNRRKK